MNTRTPLIPVIALLAGLPALRVLAQTPAAPAAADAAVTTPATAPAATTPATAPGTTDAAAATPAAPTTSATPAAVKAEDGAVGTATKGKDAAGRDTLSVDFPDEDIRNILRNVADLFELNIIMPDTLQGKTTIKLRDVTWRQIFQSVLQPVNYTYVEDGNIIKIVSNDSLAQEPTSTDVFLINYAKAADILPTINTLVDASAGGKIVVDTRSNSLVITERPSRMNRIRPIIEQLDRATDQVMIESKFVEVTDSDVKNLGVNWSSLANYQINAGNISSSLTRTHGQAGQDGNNRVNNNGFTDSNRTNADNQTVVTNGQNGGSSNTSAVSSSNGGISTNSQTSTNSGLTNSTTNTNTNGTTRNTTTDLSSTFQNLMSITNNADTTRTLSAVFSASDFNVVLSALQQLQKTKIVSNPTIVTLNNTQATINVGQERPIPSYTYNQERGVYEVSGFTYKPIGVILKVTPQVNSRGYIKLTVEPEVSQSSRDANFNGASIPIVESRKAVTTVSLKDGFTMGIGGLMQQTTGNGQTKVPVLGSLPVLGRLFRSDNKNTESTNLIIFITAKTLSAEGEGPEKVFNSERIRGLDMDRTELPGYGRDGAPGYGREADPFVKPVAVKTKK